MKFVGWAACALVVATIFTAWLEPTPTGLVNAAALTLAGGLALYSILVNNRLPVHWVTLLPLACAAWGVFQVWSHGTVFPFETWNSIDTWLARAALFSIAYAGFQDTGSRSRLRSGITWFGGVFSLLTLLQWYTSGGTVFWLIQTRYTNEIAGTFANRDHYAALMELILPIALAAAIQHQRSALPSAVCAGFIFSSVIASGSKAGTIIVCIEVLVFLAAAWFQRGDHRRAGILAASLILCTAAGGWDFVWERFHSADLFAYRREMLTATASMIRAKPFAGFGLGTWPSVYPAFAIFDPPGVYMNHAHNDWAELTAEGGLPLLAILIAFGCVSTLSVRKRLWVLGIPAVLAHALVDFPLQRPALAFALFFLAGVAAADRIGPRRSPASLLRTPPEKLSKCTGPTTAHVLEHSG